MFWICKCGATRKLSGKSHSNVVSHVRLDHPKEYQVLVDELSMSPTADIVKDPIFEKAICKLQDGQQLERYETAVLKSFEVEKPDASSSGEEESLSLAARALKCRKLQQRTSACYVDTRFVVPTQTCANVSFLLQVGL